MLRKTRVQMAAVLAAGALLGYLAATGLPTRLSWAGTSRPPAENPTVKPAEPAKDDAEKR